MSVMPEWYLSKYSFHENNIPWEKGSWSQDTYDKSLFGENRPGAMGPYHPVIHYMTMEEFESIKNKPIKPVYVPEWKPAPYLKKVQELKQAFADLRQARQNQNSQAIRSAVQKIRKIWDDLPESAHQKIEEKFPGITQKIEGIRLEHKVP